VVEEGFVGAVEVEVVEEILEVVVGEVAVTVVVAVEEEVTQETVIGRAHRVIIATLQEGMNVIDVVKAVQVVVAAEVVVVVAAAAEEIEAIGIEDHLIEDRDDIKSATLDFLYKFHRHF